MWKTGRILPMLHGWRRIGRMEDPKILTINKPYSCFITVEHIDYDVISHLLSRKYSSIQSNYSRLMVEDMGNQERFDETVGRIGRVPSKPNWNNFNGFETPFGAMAEILQSWPGTTQTSEQDDDERHLRLISTIAGYPEILTGRRPLDIPLHNKSELAFKLSEFLDCIKPDSHSEWHSLRSLLLHHDLVHFSTS